MKTMYPAQVNSPGTELAAAIDAAQDTIQVADGSVLPDGPNLLTIGTDEAAETILYTGKTGDELTGITRGFQGTAQSWAAGTKVARYFTAYDHDAATSNISELSTGLNEARDRLDIEERQDVVLNAGMQILNAQRRAAFSLSGIKGRTLVNLLGRMGSCEDTSKVHPMGISTTTITLSTDRTQGSSSFKVVQTVSGSSGSGVAGFKFPTLSHLKTGGKYLLVADFKTETLDSLTIHAELWGSLGTRFEAVIGKTWSTQFFPLEAAADFKDLFMWGMAAGTFFVDAIRLYEVSDTEYVALANMTPEQVAAKYPYVDSVQPVRNPYAIRYGENLAPNYPEAKTNFDSATAITPVTVLGTYEVRFSGEAVSKNVDKGVYFDIPVIPGQTYTAAVDSLADNGFIRFEYWKDRNSTGPNLWVKNPDFFPSNVSATITVPTGCSYMRVYYTNQEVLTYNNGTLTNESLIGGNYHFKNWRLFPGTKDLGFKPSEDSMLALQTDLFADPLTGANADEVFEKDGQYFKLAKWKKQTIDGLLDWRLNPQPRIGYKEVYVPGLVAAAIKGGGHASKFDGKILMALKVGETTTAGDQFLIYSDNAFVLAISNTDSGWGDNYTPTPDEIKAYFMGWRMFQWGVGYDPYNGSGTKGWGKIYCGVGPDDGNGMVAGSGISTLPTTMNDMGYTPYQLVYQLATPTVEPIVSEGMLTFNEGDNQIEVGTGLVVRERANFVWNGTSSYTYNSNVVGAQKAKYMVKDFVHVYENSRQKYGTNKTVRTTSNGTTLDIPMSAYDPSAAYSVTYLMLDKSPVVPFIGSYAANEKAMLQELTDAVQQNATAVSVLMNKKADKDAPGWITPTLLNGWVNFGSGYNEAGYQKNSEGVVRFRGVIRNGTIGQTLFVLPSGYRPLNPIILDAISHNNSTYVASGIKIFPDGRIVLEVGSFYHLSLESINPFLAEQ